MRRVSSDQFPHGSRTIGKELMSEGLTADEREDYFEPGQLNGSQDGASYSYGALFDAPDFSSLIKGRRSAHAREYETKVKSGLKSVTIAALRSGDLADAATILHHGPGFAAASGDLCAANDKAKAMVDMITAPDNPYVSFAFIAVPFIAQLMRNHEKTLEQIPDARKAARARRKERKQAEDTRKVATLHIPLMRREIKIRVGMRVNPLRGFGKGFRASTRQPSELIMQVFSDEKLIAALEKQGISIVQTNEPV